jgi:hypothetical protein
VLVVGSEHLAGLGQDFRPELFRRLREVLDDYRPDVVAVEALPPEDVARLSRDAAAAPEGPEAQLLAAFAADATRYGRQAQEALGLSFEAAGAAAASLLSANEESTEAHRSLALHLLAAYDLPSAVLQWSYLSEEQRDGSGAVTSDIADALNRHLASPREIVSIGVAVARRLRLQRLVSIDDHVDDEIGLKTGLNEALANELQGNAAYLELAASPYFQEARSRLADAAKAGDLLPLYIRLNSTDYLNQDVSAQWHLFYRTSLPSKRDRARASLWEARNLNIASRIRTHSASHPGGRILVVIGAAHKPFLDTYLAQMMDIKVVQLGELMRGKERGLTR